MTLVYIQGVVDEIVKEDEEPRDDRERRREKVTVESLFKQAPSPEREPPTRKVNDSSQQAPAAGTFTSSPSGTRRRSDGRALAETECASHYNQTPKIDDL